jgi:hypothetical protein
MSSEHRCQCGQLITVAMPWSGFAYVAMFRPAGETREVHNCPSCGTGLYAELKAGRLVEVAAK